MDKNDESEDILYENDSCLELLGRKELRELMDHKRGSFKNLVYPEDADRAKAVIGMQQRVAPVRFLPADVAPMSSFG